MVWGIPRHSLVSICPGLIHRSSNRRNSRGLHRNKSMNDDRAEIGYQHNHGCRIKTPSSVSNWRRRVREAAALSSRARHVLAVMGEYLNHEGYAWPSIDRLSAESGLSTRTVDRALHDAIQAGWVVRNKIAPTAPHNWPSNLYSITAPNQTPHYGFIPWTRSGSDRQLRKCREWTEAVAVKPCVVCSRAGDTSTKGIRAHYPDPEKPSAYVWLCEHHLSALQQREALAGTKSGGKSEAAPNAVGSQGRGIVPIEESDRAEMQNSEHPDTDSHLCDTVTHDNKCNGLLGMRHGGARRPNYTNGENSYGSPEESFDCKSGQAQKADARTADAIDDTAQVAPTEPRPVDTVTPPLVCAGPSQETNFQEPTAATRESQSIYELDHTQFNDRESLNKLSREQLGWVLTLQAVTGEENQCKRKSQYANHQNDDSSYSTATSDAPSAKRQLRARPTTKFRESPRQLAEMLGQLAEKLVRQWFPDAVRKSEHFQLGDLDGNPGQSVRIYHSGAKQGKWFEGNTSSGGDWQGQTSGDMLDLLAHCERIDNKSALYRRAREILGITNSGPNVAPTNRCRESVQRKENAKNRTPSSGPTAPTDMRAISSDSPVGKWLTENRGLSLGALECYRVCEIPSKSSAAFPSYAESSGLSPTHIKCRNYKAGLAGQRGFWAVAGGNSNISYGRQAVDSGASELIYCEGEIDAISWFQSTAVPALSMPSGSARGWIKNDSSWLAGLPNIETIYIAPDLDAVGQSGIPEMCAAFGVERCRVVTKLPLSAIDANEAIMDGATDADMRHALEQSVPASTYLAALGKAEEGPNNAK